MERRVFLGLSAAAVAAWGGGTAWAQDADPGLAGAVAKLADLLETGYVFPAVGKRYATMLRAKLASGGYAAITDPTALGDQLTNDLRGVSPDNHLRVAPEAAVAGGAGPRVRRIAGPQPQGGPGPQPASAPPPGRPPRRSVEDAGWLAKGIAYIRFTGFTGDPDAVAATAAFMKDHAAATSIIIDCRYNGGGGIAEMNAMLPYLYPRETVLVQMEMVGAIVKARGDPWADDKFIRPARGAAPGVVRSEHYVVPRTDETRLFGAKLFYLTSNRTASAAEHLALALRHTRRAVQIGETTAGANHFGGFEPIGAGLAVFLPVGRTIDPATGKDWEGVGIAPDVAIAPPFALEETLRRAGALS